MFVAWLVVFSVVKKNDSDHMVMSSPHSSPGPGEWALERDRYVILLHLYTMRRADGAGSLRLHSIMRDLGVHLDCAESLVGPLKRANLVEESSSGDALALTAAGVAYIERGAKRRRSVRLEI